ncbi:hypothetical protein NPIL_148671 [Nephila pilipes]|uniref:Uncharacterized protein n=1 Tax=Nephila pilipes TaxID=299642 RepID=A0A8X6PWY2_NEPPI|nr:hypothetical protein NPIL_148671 [Nephila pilipes]
MAINGRAIRNWLDQHTDTPVVSFPQDTHYGNKVTDEVKDVITDTEKIKKVSKKRDGKIHFGDNVEGNDRYELVRSNRGIGEPIDKLDYAARMSLLGVFVFVGISAYVIYFAFKQKRKNADDTLRLSEI